MSYEGMEWRDEVYAYLDANAAEEPYAIHYMNITAIQEIRALYQQKSRAKSIVSQRKLYRLETLLVLNSERRDIDGGHKILQDTITKWIADRREGQIGVGFDDRRIVNVEMFRLVDKHAPEHIEVAMTEIPIEWASGSLVLRHMQQTQENTPPFWKGNTHQIEKIVVDDIAQQNTLRIPALTKELRDDTVSTQITRKTKAL